MIDDALTSADERIVTTRVRAAKSEDTSRLGELAGILVRMHHALDPSRFISGEGVDVGYGRWLWKEAKRGAVVLVAENDADQIVGYAYATLEAQDWIELLGAHGKLHDLIVDPTERRHGHARVLLSAAIEELKRRGAPRIVLSTAVKNGAAQALFGSFGFEPTMVEMTKSLG